MTTPERDPDPRQRLLDAAVDHAAHHGVGDLGLRQLAAALGTSHRMLIYHFGSKEGLLVEIVRAVEARQRNLLAELASPGDPAAPAAPADLADLAERAELASPGDPAGPADLADPAEPAEPPEGTGGSPADRMWTMWHHLTDPALAPWERLFFEVYGQALQGRAHTATFLDDVVDGWLEPVAAILREAGVPDGDVPAEARLALAVTRGLLLDLLATGDRGAVDEAMARFAARYGAQRSPESGSGLGAGTLSRSSRSRAPVSR